MQILRALFPLKCEECGRTIEGEGLPGLGPGPICRLCHTKLEEERELGYQKANRKTAQQVVDRVRRDFRPEDFDEVFTILSDYGKAADERASREFMWLAILRLANGKKHLLADLVSRAKFDYRDILAPVQYKYGLDWLEKFVNEQSS